MSRIPLVSSDDIAPSARDFVDRRGGLAVYRLMANAPAVFAGWTKMVEQVLGSSTFAPRMHELVVLRVAYLADSSYEIGHHLVRARNAGISQLQLDALTSTGDLTAAGFNDAELAVLQFVTDLCRTNHVSDDIFTAARAVLGTDEAITELLILVSLYHGLALVLNAAELELDETVWLQSGKSSAG